MSEAVKTNLLWLIPTVLLGSLYAILAGTGSLIGIAALLSAIAAAVFLTVGVRPLVILLLAGVPTVFVFPNTVIQSIPVLNTERLVYLSIVGLMLVPVIFKAGTRTRLNQPEKYAALFLAVALLSYLTGLLRGTFPANPVKDGYFFLQYVMGFSGFMIARRLPWHQRSIMQLIDVMLAVGCFMAGQAFLQYFLGVEAFVPGYLEVPHADEGRATGTFSNASEYGAVATTILLLGIYRLGSTRDALARVIVVLMLGLVCAAILLSKTRAPWLAALVSLVLVAVLDTRTRALLVSCMVIGLIVGVVALPLVVDLAEFRERFTSLGPIAERLAIWVAAISMGLQNPILGVGFGPEGFNSALPDYAMDFFGISARWASGLAIPHNELLHVFSLTGILGIYLYVAIILSIARCLTRFRERTPASAADPIALLAGYTQILLVNWIINGLFVDTGAFWYLMFLVFFFIGAAVSMIDRNPASQVVPDVRK